MDKKKVALGLGAIFALLYASKDKLNKVIEEKKQEIAKEQWTKKNEITLLSMQELEQRTIDEEKTLEAQINADNKDISLSEYSVFGRFPSDSEGVSYLESAYILPYIDSERKLFVRDFSLSYLQDAFLFDNFEELRYSFNNEKFAEDNYLLSRYEPNGLVKYFDALYPFPIESWNFDYEINKDYTKNYGAEYSDETALFQILQTSLPKVYNAEDYELGKNEYIPKSFGFISDFADDIGVFLFVPLNFWVPPMEKGRKFTFEKFNIKNISVKTNVNNGYNEELNKGLQVLNLYNYDTFTSEEIIRKKKNQLEMLNFIKNKYVVSGVNYFYIPLMLYFPKYNFKAGEWIEIYKFNKSKKNGKFHTFNDDYNILMSAFNIYGSVEDLSPDNDMNLQYFINGLSFIKEISFDVEYKFLETLTNEVHLVCNYDLNENITDVSELAERKIITNSEQQPKNESINGVYSLGNRGDYGKGVNYYLNKYGIKDRIDIDFSDIIFYDKIFQSYLNYFNSDFVHFLDNNVLVRSDISLDEIIERQNEVVEKTNAQSKLDADNNLNA